MRALIDKFAKLFPQSLIAEFHRIFGPEDTEKLVTIFAGTTLQIPSSKELHEAQRDLAIYTTIAKSKSAAESRRLGSILCKQYNLGRKEMRTILIQTKRKLKDAKKFVDSDQKVSSHLAVKGTKRVKREDKRRRM